jgi:hypothetical protein
VALEYNRGNDPTVGDKSDANTDIVAGNPFAAGLFGHVAGQQFIR